MSRDELQKDLAFSEEDRQLLEDIAFVKLGLDPRTKEQELQEIFEDARLYEQSPETKQENWIGRVYSHIISIAKSHVLTAEVVLLCWLTLSLYFLGQMEKNLEGEIVRIETTKELASDIGRAMVSLLEVLTEKAKPPVPASEDDDLNEELEEVLMSLSEKRTEKLRELTKVRRQKLAAFFCQLIVGFTFFPTLGKRAWIILKRRVN